MNTQKPNIDQSSKGSLPASLRDVLTSWLRDNVEGMLPARVVSYDDSTNRAVIKPIVMLGTTGGTKISRAQISNIPVYRFGGGGFFMRFPLNPGDLGWLKANDRDISLIMQSNGGEDWPNTKRLHSFSDAMFFPDSFRNWVIGEGNAEAAVFQSLDGTVVISLHDDKIELTAPTIEINGNVDIAGGTFTHNGINVGSTHTHTNVEPGSGSSGGPQ